MEQLELVIFPHGKLLEVEDYTDNRYFIKYRGKDGKIYRKWFARDELQFAPDISTLKAHEKITSTMDGMMAELTKPSPFSELDPQVYENKLREWRKWSKSDDFIIYEQGNKSAKAYAAQEIRTESINSNLAHVFSDNNYVLVDQHEDCSPLCLPYQAKVLYKDRKTWLADRAASDNKHIYDDMIYYGDATTYTDEGWLFHPWCRHSVSQYFPEFNSPPKKKWSDDEVMANYAERERNRSRPKRKRTLPEA